MGGLVFKIHLLMCVFFLIVRFSGSVLAVPGLHCCMGFSPVVVSGGCCLVAGHGLLPAVASLLAEHGLWGTGSMTVAHGFSCSAAHGIFLDQGSNLCLLHRQVDSFPRSHQGTPWMG